MQETLDTIEAAGGGRRDRHARDHRCRRSGCPQFSSTYHEPLKGARVAVTGTGLLAAKLRKSLEEAGASTECVLSLELESCRSGEAMKATL